MAKNKNGRAPVLKNDMQPCTNASEQPKRFAAFFQRLSLLRLLVFFTFSVLLVSVAVAGSFVYLLVRTGALPAVTEHRLPALLLLLWFISLFIGTVFATFGGDRVLRPLRSMIDATREISTGNFDVRVDVNSVPELARLAQSFNEMAKELSSIETLRSDFVSNVSHEFKTPVASIKGFAKRLKKSDLTVEQREEYLDIIIAESERLTQLSGNVLLLSKLESGGMEAARREPFALDEQLRRVVLLLQPQIQAKELDVELYLDTAPMTANKETLHHLWLNLLSNAIKFSPSNGIITVALKCNEDNAVVTVSDSGIGMSDEVKAHIFDKFYQGDSSRATAGNGLGLALVNRIVELEGGRIFVDSAEGQGSCFTVMLPI